MLYTFELCAADKVHIKTELLYALAEARAKKYALARIIYTNEVQRNVIETVLRSMKKRRSIDLFVPSEAVNAATTEASFLHNKFENELIEAAKTPHDYFIIHIL